ncbi:unnamed protein product, partial [marine sediment metagenome]
MTEDIEDIIYSETHYEIGLDDPEVPTQPIDSDQKEPIDVYSDVPDAPIRTHVSKRKRSYITRRGKGSLAATKKTVNGLLNKLRRFYGLLKRMVKKRLKIIKYVFIIQLFVNILGVNIPSIIFIIVNWFNVPIIMYVFALIDIIKVIMQII